MRHRVSGFCAQILAVGFLLPAHAQAESHSLTTQDFGAVGDGLADDSAALRKALQTGRVNPPNGGLTSPGTTAKARLTLSPAPAMRFKS
jgi:hypothetical protein